MTEYIDRDALKQEMYRRCIGTDDEMEKGRAKWDSGLWIRYKVFEDAIADAPTIPVVRCKDCIWYEIREQKQDGSDDRRFNPSLCTLYGKRRGANWFCADGQRRER